MKTILLSLLTLTLTTTALTLGVKRSAAPSYQQRPLSVWLEDLDTLDFAQWTQAAEAIRAMGSHALPTLGHRLRAKDSELARKLIELCEDYPVLALVPAEAHYESALEACRILGPTAAPLLKDIIPFLEDNRRAKAVKVTVAIGDAAIPALESALRNEDAQARAGAAVALGTIARKPESVVPALRDLLSDGAAETRMAAVWALGRFGEAAAAAVPQISHLTNDAAFNVRTQAAVALDRILMNTQALGFTHLKAEFARGSRENHK